jgi:succinyl-CoA synthetase beta subunit
MYAVRLLGAQTKSAELLVQEMVSGIELIVGARHDPQFGPFLVVGAGGVFVDLIEDTSVRLLPVDEQEAISMLQELRIFRLLQGFRGQTRRDIDAVCRAMTGLSELFLEHQAWLSDLEINPLVVRNEGAGVVAVDVKIIKNSTAC